MVYMKQSRPQKFINKTFALIFILLVGLFIVARPWRPTTYPYRNGDFKRPARAEGCNLFRRLLLNILSLPKEAQNVNDIKPPGC